MTVRVCVCEGGTRGGKTIVFLQYVTHKRVAETNISKQVKQEVFGLFFSSLDTININIVQV